MEKNTQCTYFFFVHFRSSTTLFLHYIVCLRSFIVVLTPGEKKISLSF